VKTHEFHEKFEYFYPTVLLPHPKKAYHSKNLKSHEEQNIIFMLSIG